MENEVSELKAALAKTLEYIAEINGALTQQIIRNRAMVETMKYLESCFDRKFQELLRDTWSSDTQNSRSYGHVSVSQAIQSLKEYLMI